MRTPSGWDYRVRVPAYLDAASGAPLHPVARAALDAACDDGWADPERLYGAGRRARLLLDAATESLADSIGVRPDELRFAADGSRARHVAVLGTLAGAPSGRDTLVHSAVEHSAILHAAAWHEQRGGRAVAVGVDASARIDATRFVAAVRSSGVAAAALQAANHEVGTRQPVDAVAAELGDVPLVVDAAHSVGHDPLPRSWDVLTADARLWGAPTLGVLAVRTGTRWRDPFPVVGGSAAGIPALPIIVSAAAGLRAVIAERDYEARRLAGLVERIRRAVPSSLTDVEVLGDPTDRLPHIVTFSCLYVDGESLLLGLDRAGFAVSSGSSCTSSTLEPSHVLVAMGALTSGNIRVSLHRDTSEQDVADFLDVLPGVLAATRAQLQ